PEGHICSKRRRIGRRRIAIRLPCRCEQNKNRSAGIRFRVASSSTCEGARRCRTAKCACTSRLGVILNRMVQYQPHFDASFAALSDATRRGVLEHLINADASITDLAGRFGMTLTGMKKHVSVLEAAGLVATQKVGRVRTCRLGTRGLE